MAGRDARHDPQIRARVVALAEDLLRTLSDPTQAWDIAVADFEYEIDRLTLPDVNGR